MARMIFLVICLVACLPEMSSAGQPAAGPVPEGKAEAVFAGGCFWCMEKPFEKLEGVASVESGYTGGEIEGPTYSQVSGHRTKHLEAVRVVYDPKLITYARLLEVFWHNVDPTQPDGQFCDRGHQYTTAIFVGNEAERSAAEASKVAVAKELNSPIFTPVRDAAVFWLAEDYHQDFYKKSPDRYYSYRKGCGRDRRLQELWGDSAGH